MQTLHEYFRKIKRNHVNKVRMKSAKVVLGPSVIRALSPRIKNPLKKELSKLTIKGLKRWATDQESFEKSFLKKTEAIKKLIPGKKKVKNKWQEVNKHAHAHKILALYCRELLNNSWGEINHETYRKIEKLLFCPVDKKVIDKIRKLKDGAKLLGKVKSMRSMTEKTFMDIQHWLRKGATDVPRVWFDDVWI